MWGKLQHYNSFHDIQTASIQDKIVSKVFIMHRMAGYTRCLIFWNPTRLAIWNQNKEWVPYMGHWSNCSRETTSQIVAISPRVILWSHLEDSFCQELFLVKWAGPSHQNSGFACQLVSHSPRCLFALMGMVQNALEKIPCRWTKIPWRRFHDHEACRACLGKGESRYLEPPPSIHLIITLGAV